MVAGELVEARAGVYAAWGQPGLCKATRAHARARLALSIAGDARDFYDHAEVQRKRFDLDWAEALRTM